MTRRPRLVATDLDGTLLGSDGRVSRRTAEAVARVEAAGVPVVIVTGRPPRWLSTIATQLDHRGIAVCANGAVIWDLHTDSMVESDPLAPDVLRDVTSRLRAELGEASFAVEYGDSFTHEATYPVRWEQPNPHVTVGALAELLAQPAVKLLMRHPTYGPDELLSAAEAILGDSVTLTHSSSDGLLEISTAGVTKASGLARVAASHGIGAEDVLAFGDMPNDLPMFAWAGHSVAMANAHPAVLDAADELTASNAEDGVAVYLEMLFP
ncbi:MAG: HAD family phosphatase [Geodermatophilaceae bacterium]|nr:HAD family phosphatase [Geodermatophilaceae bacterium]